MFHINSYLNCCYINLADLMVSPLGLEPRTIPLKALCITQQPLFNGNSEYVNVRFLELRTSEGRQGI